MRVRQVGSDQGSCDVGGLMCARTCVCVFLCVFAIVMTMYLGRFAMSFFELESK